MMRVVEADEILKKIERGEPVEYDNVIVKGDLDLSKLDLQKAQTGPPKFGPEFRVIPKISQKFVKSRIGIRNSVIEGRVDSKKITFKDLVEFDKTCFIKKVIFCESKFRGYAFFRTLTPN